MMLPAGAKKIADITEYMSCIRPLTHVAVFRKLEYYHHYLVLNVGDNFVDIVHYSSVKALAKIFKQKIHFDSDLLDFSSGVFLIKNHNYPSTDAEKESAYERMYTRLGETEYSASSNNCESFVTWVLTGEAKCEQFEQSSPGKRSLADCIDSGLDQVKKAISGICSFDLKTWFAAISFSIPNLLCFFIAWVLKIITGAKTYVKAGLSAVAAGVSTRITVAAAVPIEVYFCVTEILGLYKRKKKRHLSTKNFTRQVTKQIGGSASSIVTATGSEFIGACIGQAKCPNPILGGVIGGSFGGIVGSLGGRAAGAVVFGQIFDAISYSLTCIKNYFTALLAKKIIPTKDHDN